VKITELHNNLFDKMKKIIDKLENEAKLEHDNDSRNSPHLRYNKTCIK